MNTQDQYRILGYGTSVSFVAVIIAMVGKVINDDSDSGNNPSNDDTKQRLSTLDAKIRQASFRLRHLESSTASAREHYTKLMSKYGFTVIPSEIEMKRRPDLKMAKKRWDELQRQTDSVRGYIFKLSRERKELRGEL